MQNHEILINNRILNKSVLAKLNNLLKSNDLVEVNFFVAFISSDGIYLLINELQELISKRVKVVIITGFMNNFNSPKTFELLLRIPGLEVRIADIAGFHSKLYIFKHSNHISYIVGSSNLTNNALRRNEEMNIFIENKNSLELNEQFAKYSHDLYHSSKLLTHELLADYSQKYYQINPKPKTIDYSNHNLSPNKMQRKALANLTALRENQQQRALLISATGSGKTFLSAFDAKRFKPQKLLFIAHRENLLNNAIASFQQVFSDLNFGKLTGKHKETQAKFLFSSILTLCKDEALSLFKPDEFDYIIIDEVHRSGAASYQKVLNYFKPKFMLGMSATPNRNDDFDIYRLFDHNIAYQIRLNEALEEELICPFHYFGIAELQINGKYLTDYSDFNSIDYHARVKHIIANLKLYGHAGNKVKGLVFTSRIEEAHKLSELFNSSGYRTCCLTGNDNESKREEAIALLENDYTDSKGNPQAYLDYIFTVDIFNEGVDIPAVNQIVLLRPTQSAIIFVQQIGRGLRKTANKEYCVIIDFIGNYKSNFLIATALSGDNSYDKENLRHFVHEANSIIPVNATVNFDKITREQIYASINRFTINKKFIEQSYVDLKALLNRVPRLIDFKRYNSIDPKLIFKYSGKSAKILYNNYYELLLNQSDNPAILNNEQGKYLNYLSQELLFASRPDDLFVLYLLINGVFDIGTISSTLACKYNTYVNAKKIQAIIKILNLETSAALAQKYQICLIKTIGESELALSDQFKLNLENSFFADMVNQLLELGLSYFEDYNNQEKEDDFIIYNKYTRREVTRLLNVNLSLETSIYGYRVIENHIPIFITYTKQENSLFSNRYDNQFLDNRDFIWFSSLGSKLENKEVQAIINHQALGLKILIFMKKSDNEGGGHYYLGIADVHHFEPETFNGRTRVKFILRLRNPLVDTYYNYFIN